MSDLLDVQGSMDRFENIGSKAIALLECAVTVLQDVAGKQAISLTTSTNAGRVVKAHEELERLVFEERG